MPVWSVAGRRVGLSAVSLNYSYETGQCLFSLFAGRTVRGVGLLIMTEGWMQALHCEVRSNNAYREIVIEFHIGPKPRIQKSFFDRRMKGSDQALTLRIFPLTPSSFADLIPS